MNRIETVGQRGRSKHTFITDSLEGQSGKNGPHYNRFITGLRCIASKIDKSPIGSSLDPQ